jgi:hypothetical protein
MPFMVGDIKLPDSNISSATIALRGSSARKGTKCKALNKAIISNANTTPNNTLLRASENIYMNIVDWKN